MKHESIPNTKHKTQKNETQNRNDVYAGRKVVFIPLNKFL